MGLCQPGCSCSFSGRCGYSYQPDRAQGLMYLPENVSYAISSSSSVAASNLFTTTLLDLPLLAVAMLSRSPATCATWCKRLAAAIHARKSAPLTGRCGLKFTELPGLGVAAPTDASAAASLK
eukprot:COSAG01_NODE_3289_length_6308_cov_4.032533_5_plen_122_part_00